MYTLMAINVTFLSIVTRHDLPPIVSTSVPAALMLVTAGRAVLWAVRRGMEPSFERIRRHLRGTIVAAAVLSILFGSWGLWVFSQVDAFHRTSIALYIFVGSISCCYCLQALPAAAYFVLLFGAAPVTLRMLFSGDWYLAGIAVTFLLVAGLILRTLAGTRAAFREILQSRSEMSALVTALQHSEENYRYSVELNPQIPWIADPSGAIVELSWRWSAYTGITIEHALGAGWLAAVHSDDRRGLVEAWHRARTEGAAAGVNIRYRLREHGGTYRWFRARANPRRDADGTILKWYGTLEDIDEQVAAELALRESEERYRLASRATNDLIWDWCPETGRIQWAGEVDTVFGYSEISHGTSVRWWLERIHPEDRPAVLDLGRRVIDNQQDSWTHEHRFRSGDGTYIHVFARGCAIRDAEGRATRAIGAMHDVTLARRAEADLRWAAYHDALTDLPNRKLAGEELEQALEKAAAQGSCVGVIVVDVDGFKSINDSLGDAAGDTVLTTIARQLHANVPAGATVARLGGDEFAVILPGLTPDDARAGTVSEILRGVGEAMKIDEGVIDVSVSAGAAMWPADGQHAEDIMKSADLALYVAKAEGAGTIRGFQPAMRDRVEDRNRMLRDAREALHDDRVIPFYQPKIALASGEVVGFEALLRWHHHRAGLQPPGGIAAAFEDSALSIQLTDRMLDRVLADMRKWTDQGLAFGGIAINGSPVDFRRDDFADRILTRFHQAGISPALLELEVTETVFLGRFADSVERAFRTLTAEGVRIALDDFGTGYASLTHLQQYPVKVLKIDRSFISRLDLTDCANAAIVQGVIEIAHRMDIETVAEGIETQAQADHLRELGCDVGQGFLYSRALAGNWVPMFLEGWSSREGLSRGVASHRPPTSRAS